MRILEFSTDHLNAAPEMARAVGGHRTEGIHISEIIRDISNKVTHKGKRKHYDQLSAEERKRMGAFTSMGWAFEEIIRRSLRNVWSVRLRDNEQRYQSPGECFLDGLVGTPDWLDTVDWAVIEFKATWKSSRRPIEQDFISWLWQIKAYCKMLATRQAQLYVFFVNGDYRESGPQLKGFQLEFTEEEIEDTWKMLLKAARTLS